MIEVRHSATACMLVEKGIGVAVVDAFSAGTPRQWNLEVRPYVPALTITASLIHLLTARSRALRPSSLMNCEELPSRRKAA